MAELSAPISDLRDARASAYAELDSVEPAKKPWLRKSVMETPTGPVDLTRLYGRPGVNHPNQLRKFEQPWHRAAAYLFAAGKSRREVAEAVDKSEQTVGILLRNAWFQETVTLLMAENGGRDIMDLFKAEQFNSLITLIELRDDKKAPSAVRKACASDILDRVLGKPLQRVETSGDVSSADPVTELEQLKQRNATLSSELQKS